MRANLLAMQAGSDTTETRLALDEAVRTFAEYLGGHWLTLFWFANSNFEDLIHEHHH